MEAMSPFAFITLVTLISGAGGTGLGGLIGALFKSESNRTISLLFAFAGGVTKEARACNGAGIDAFFPVLQDIQTRQEAMLPENATKNLSATAEQVFRLIRLF